MSGAQALLQAMIDNPQLRPGIKAEAKGMLELMRYLHDDDMAHLLRLAVGMAADLQTRVCELERHLNERF